MRAFLQMRTITSSISSGFRWKAQLAHFTKDSKFWDSQVFLWKKIFSRSQKKQNQDHLPCLFKLSNKEASEVHTIDLITTNNFTCLSLWSPYTSSVDMMKRNCPKLVAVLCMDWITRAGYCAAALLMRLKSSMTEIFKFYSNLIISDWLVLYKRSKMRRNINNRTVLHIILKCWNQYN